MQESKESPPSAGFLRYGIHPIGHRQSPREGWRTIAELAHRASRMRRLPGLQASRLAGFQSSSLAGLRACGLARSAPSSRFQAPAGGLQSPALAPVEHPVKRAGDVQTADRSFGRLGVWTAVTWAENPVTGYLYRNGSHQNF